MDPDRRKRVPRGVSFLDFELREGKKAKSNIETENGIIGHPRHPIIPEDLSVFSEDELIRLYHVLAEYMDSDPPHPELQPDLDRLAAAIAERQGAAS